PSPLPAGGDTGGGRHGTDCGERTGPAQGPASVKPLLFQPAPAFLAPARLPVRTELIREVGDSVRSAEQGGPYRGRIERGRGLADQGIDMVAGFGEADRSVAPQPGWSMGLVLRYGGARAVASSAALVRPGVGHRRCIDHGRRRA